MSYEKKSFYLFYKERFDLHNLTLLLYFINLVKQKPK